MARRLALLSTVALVVVGGATVLLVLDVLNGNFLNEDFGYSLLIWPLFILGTAVATVASVLALTVARRRQQWAWVVTIGLLQLIATGSLVTQLVAPNVGFQLLTVHTWRLDGGFFHVYVMPELVVPLLQLWAPLVTWTYVRNTLRSLQPAPSHP